MKKAFVIIFTVMLFVFLALNVKADSCSNEEKARLKKEAAKVKMVYEEIEEIIAYEPVPDYGNELVPVKSEYFKISINNITNEMRVIINNSIDENYKRVDYSITDNGVYSFDWTNIYEIVNFTFEVYGNTSSCSGVKLATGYLKTPKYNILHKTALCKGVTGLSACDKYIMENTSQDELKKRIREYKEKQTEENLKPKTIFQEFMELVKEHKILVIGGTIIIGGLGVALVIKKRRKRAI